MRYYTLILQKTLFGEYELKRIYGNIANKKPTGIKREFFCSYEQAEAKFTKLLKRKRAKGYRESY